MSPHLTRVLRLMLLGCASTVGGGCHDPTVAADPAARMRTADKDLIQTLDASTAADHAPVGTLLEALQAAGLIDALSAAGPFTLFAPTDDAFRSLPPLALDDLLKPQNKDKLRDVLLYHVHAGAALLSADARTTSLSTVQGRPLALAVNDGAIRVNDAKVIKADVVCKNGVIYWIDKVLMPPPAVGN